MLNKKKLTDHGLLNVYILVCTSLYKKQCSVSRTNLVCLHSNYQFPIKLFLRMDEKPTVFLKKLVVRQGTYPRRQVPHSG